MRCWSLLLILLLFPTGSSATPAPVLRGLERMHVRVDYLADPVVEAGWDEEAVHRRLSLELGRAGYLVLDAGDEAEQGSAMAVSFDATETPYGAVAYHASLELREDVSLLRSPEVLARGSVWFTSTFGIASPASMEEDVEAALDLLLEAFLTEAGLLTP